MSMRPRAHVGAKKKNELKNLKKVLIEPEKTTLHAVRAGPGQHRAALPSIAREALYVTGNKMLQAEGHTDFPGCSLAGAGEGGGAALSGPLQPVDGD